MSREQIARWTRIAGIVYIVLVLGILFVPVFGSNCVSRNTGSMLCERYVPYAQLSGTVRGYFFLALMGAIGIGALYVAYASSTSRIGSFCRHAVWITLICILLESWTFGLYFVLGVLLMLAIAFMSWTALT